MATTCFGPPPLPPNKRQSSLAKDLQRKNSFNQSPDAHSSSTYMSFKDPLDEIVVLNSENDKKKCHHKRKNSLKRCKHALNLSLAKFTQDDKKKLGEDAPLKSSSMVAKLENEKEYFLHSPDESYDAIPLKTFNEILSRGCEDLTNVDDISYRSPFATVKNNPFSRPHSVGRSSFHTNSLTRNFKGYKLSLARSSSEGNIAGFEKETPLSLSPLGSRRNNFGTVNSSPTPSRLNKCLKVLSGSWKNLLQCKYIYN